MKRRVFTIGTIFIAMVFWFFDASIHYFVYHEEEFEYIPEDFNELWMRCVIIFLMIALGVFADHYSAKMLNAQKQLEASRIYTSMVCASHHILNNLLNQMQLFKIEAQGSKDFNQEIIKLFDNSIDEASELIEKLSRIEMITEKSIWESVAPTAAQNASDKTDLS